MLSVSHRIDRFIEAMFRKNAEQLVFFSGTPVRIRVDGVEHVLLDKLVRTEQVLKLLEPVVLGEDLFADEELSFTYEAPTGDVSLTTRWQGDKLLAVFAPAPRQVLSPSWSADIAEPAFSPQAPASMGEAAIQPSAWQSAVGEGSGLLGGNTPAYGITQNNFMETGALGSPSADLQSSFMPVNNQVPPPRYPDEAVQSRGIFNAISDSVEQTNSNVSKVSIEDVEAAISSETSPVVAQELKAQEASSILNEISQSSDIPKMQQETGGMDRMLKTLVEGKGSDLHLTVGVPAYIRVDGEMTPVEDSEVLTNATIETWIKEVTPISVWENFLETNDVDYAYEIKDLARFRMNIFRDRCGVGLVARVIPSKVLSAETLGLPQSVLSFCAFNKGLVLVTGPTGSGKSTTLAAMVDYINCQRATHIITIEDPVEFVHPSKKSLVNQREVHTHTESFSRALRAALREDPDIVLVGEMRDLETVHMAIETAETGHLVFGTLHTNSAASTIDRIIDQFPTDQQAQIRVMLSESLRGVISQMLCKKIGGGRVAALEILSVNPAVSNLIREGKTFQIPSIMQTNKGKGMQTQQDALLTLVKDKVVAPHEAIAKSINPAQLKTALERAGFMN